MLEQFSNAWEGTSDLYLKPTDPPDSSPTILAMSTLAKETFLLFNYTWRFEERDHEGFIVLRANKENGKATAAWGDSFHQKGSVMHLDGIVEESGIVDVRGSYAAPPGPDWGWRIVIDASEMEMLKITMYNIWPEGQEDIAVIAQYAAVY